MVINWRLGHDGGDVLAGPDPAAKSSAVTKRRIAAVAAAGRGRASPVRRTHRALAAVALAGLAVISLGACTATSAKGTRTYRTHGVSFDYPAGWQPGGPGKTVGCCRGDRMWTAGFVSDSASSGSVDVGANRLSPAVTAANLRLAIPSLDRSARSFFEHAGGALRAAPERITMGGMPGFRYQGSVSSGGVAADVTLVIVVNGTTDYWVTCTNTPAKAAEVARACSQVIQTFKTSQPIVTARTRTYRAHGVSFDYPAGWLQDEPAVTSGSAPLWATAFSLGPAAWMTIRADRTGLTVPITAANIGAITPSVTRAIHRLLAVQAGPERITMGGMPGLRFRGRAAVNGVSTKITLIMAFKGTTRYELACGHTPATAQEVTRACAQAMRTFKVAQAG